MYLSPMGKPKGVTVVDVLAGHEVIGFIPFSAAVRPPALSANGQLLFQHVDGLNGFEVADVEQRTRVARVKHSSNIGWFAPIKRLGNLTLKGFKRCHGLALRPDQAEIWSTCANNLTIHNVRDPSYPETHRIGLTGKGYWLTFSPDSRYAFVALSNRNQVAVVDTKSKDIVQHLDAGKAPKRNLVLTYPSR